MFATSTQGSPSNSPRVEEVQELPPSAELQKFSDQLALKHAKMATRAQKLRHVADLVLMNEPDLDQLNTLNAYIYLALQNANSHLTNCQIGVAQIFDLFVFMDENVLMNNFSHVDPNQLETNSKAVRTFKKLFGAAVMPKDYLEALGKIKSVSTTLKQDIGAYQKDFVANTGMSVLFDIETILSLRQQLYMLAQQSLNSAKRVETESTMEIYVLATLAELEVESNFS